MQMLFLSFLSLFVLSSFLFIYDTHLSLVLVFSRPNSSGQTWPGGFMGPTYLPIYHMYSSLLTYFLTCYSYVLLPTILISILLFCFVLHMIYVHRYLPSFHVVRPRWNIVRNAAVDIEFSPQQDQDDQDEQDRKID